MTRGWQSLDFNRVLPTVEYQEEMSTSWYSNQLDHAFDFSQRRGGVFCFSTFTLFPCVWVGSVSAQLRRWSECS